MASERPTIALRWLRRLTRLLSTVPGTGRIVEWVRRAFHGPRRYRIDDFDGSLSMVVRLDEHIGSRLFWYGTYDPGLLAILDTLLRPGMTVVDGGAHMGMVTLFCARRVTETGRVYAFEPSPVMAERLRFNVELNRLEQVIVAEVGLDDRPRERRLYPPAAPMADGTWDLGLSTMTPEEPLPRGDLVLVTSLDYWVQENGLQRIDIVKLDVEGSELSALEGAESTLMGMRPILLVEMEWRTTGRAGYETQGISDHLWSRAYKLARILDDGSIRWFDRGGEVPRTGNMLAVPMERFDFLEDVQVVG